MPSRLPQSSCLVCRRSPGIVRWLTSRPVVCGDTPCLACTVCFHLDQTRWRARALDCVTAGGAGRRAAKLMAAGCRLSKTFGRCSSKGSRAYGMQLPRADLPAICTRCTSSLLGQHCRFPCRRFRAAHLSICVHRPHNFESSCRVRAYCTISAWLPQHAHLQCAVQQGINCVTVQLLISQHMHMI